MRLLICAGMTGGGVYPALAVLQALEGTNLEILWIGSESGMEESLLNPYDLQYESIPAAGLHGTALSSLPGNIMQLAKGWKKARQVIKKFQPQKMFFTGGFLGVPVALADLRIPSVVFVPDIEPGLALKVILQFANRIAVSTDRSTRFIAKHKNPIISGYPIRTEIKRWDKQSARSFMELPQDVRVLLVYGGSKGARSINNALISSLNSLLPHMHILHITGSFNWEEVKKTVKLTDAKMASRYHAYPFLADDMGAALAAADLVVCRSGASTLGELPYFGLPAVLVPYPFAWRYQHQNAEYLVEHAAAVLLEDSDLEQSFAPIIMKLINDNQKLTEMGKNMKRLSKPKAAQIIADLILEPNKGYLASGGSTW
jgi:UDP-N-acetylglucosamine--N-acetylmuramyl-(pentapeptide) pyrophosphoryl-undecaprenol N-acetylglucosamine transferase